MSGQSRTRDGRRRWSTLDTPEIRLATLGSVRRLTPLLTHQIHPLVEREVGRVEYRRLQRALAWLAARGAIRRDPRGWLRVHPVADALTRALERRESWDHLPGQQPVAAPGRQDPEGRIDP